MCIRTFDSYYFCFDVLLKAKNVSRDSSFPRNRECFYVCFDITPKARSISSNKTFPRNWWFVFESRSMFRFVVKFRLCFRSLSNPIRMSNSRREVSFFYRKSCRLDALRYVINLLRNIFFLLLFMYYYLFNTFIW